MRRARYTAGVIFGSATRHVFDQLLASLTSCPGEVYPPQHGGDVAIEQRWVLGLQSAAFRQIIVARTLDAAQSFWLSQLQSGRCDRRTVAVLAAFSNVVSRLTQRLAFLF